MLERKLPTNPVKTCASSFPPIPVSLEHEISIGLMSLLELLPPPELSKVINYLKAKQLSDHLMDEAVDVLFDTLLEYPKKHSPTQKISSDQCIKLTTEILFYCRKRYQAYNRNVDTFFKGNEFQGAQTDPNIRKDFFAKTAAMIKTEKGKRFKDLIHLRDSIKKWFTAPLIACFEDSGFLFSTLDGSIKFISHCSDKGTHVAGGCGIVVEDLEAQFSTWLGYFHKGIKIPLNFEKLGIEGSEDPKEVAASLLYPPKTEHPFSDSIFQLLQGISYENVSLFNEVKEQVSDWNFIDPIGRSLVHHATKCENTYFLRELIEKGCDISAGDSQGFTPIHYAAMEGSLAA